MDLVTRDGLPVGSGDAAATLRRTIGQLHALDQPAARRVEALAFVLARVADADHVVSAGEQARMETILADAGLSTELAVLLVEIATQRRRAADPAYAYRISRELRLAANPTEQRQLLAMLLQVAAADGRIDPSEEAELLQVAAELGLDVSLAVAGGEKPL